MLWRSDKIVVLHPILANLFHRREWLTVKCFLEVYKAGIESFLSFLVVMYQAVHNEDGVRSSILPEAVLRVIQDSVNFNPPL